MIVKTLSSSIKSVEVKKDEIVFETEPYSTLARYLGEKSNATKQLLQEQANAMRGRLLQQTYEKFFWLSSMLTILVLVTIAAVAIGTHTLGTILATPAIVCSVLIVAKGREIARLRKQSDESLLQSQPSVHVSLHRNEKHLIAQLLNTERLASDEYKTLAAKRERLQLYVQDTRIEVCKYRDSVLQALSLDSSDDESEPYGTHWKDRDHSKSTHEWYECIYKEALEAKAALDKLKHYRDLQYTEEDPANSFNNTVDRLERKILDIEQMIDCWPTPNIRASIDACRQIHDLLGRFLCTGAPVCDEYINDFHVNIAEVLSGLSSAIPAEDNSLYPHMFAYWYEQVTDDSPQAIQARSFMDAAVLLRLARIEELILQAPDCDKASDFSKCNAEKFVRNEAKLLLEELQKHSESYHNMLAAMRAIDSATSSKQDLSVPDVELSAEKILQGMIDNQLQRALQHLSSPSTTPTTPKGA